MLVRAATASAGDMPPLRSEEPPFFTADLAITLDSLGHAAAGVAIYYATRPKEKEFVKGDDIIHEVRLGTTGPTKKPKR